MNIEIDHPPTPGDVLVDASSADELLSRTLDARGMGPMQLSSVLALSSVEWNRDVGTACVQCVTRPRLLLNPDFVARHCGTPERLGMLLLHELAHVTLGHTRLYPRLTRAHNIAFDAIVNRTVADAVANAGGRVREFLALPEELYQPGRSPAFLLRPPPGWPDAPDWRASRGCPEPLRKIHRRLWEAKPGGGSGTVTPAEILMHLRESGAAGSGGDSGSGEAGEGEEEHGSPLLLGSHGRTLTETLAEASRDPGLLEDALAGLFGLLQGEGGWDDGGAPRDDVIEEAARDRALEGRLRKALRRALIRGSFGRSATEVEHRPIVGPMRHRDRRAPAREALAARFGAPRPLLFHDTLSQLARARRTAHVYLDVSGSMWGMLPRLYAALVPLRREVDATVWLFSTEVVRASTADFEARRIRTTGGTDVNPVLEHLLSLGHRAPKHAAVVTDGWFAAPPLRLVRAVRDARTQVHLVLVGNDGSRSPTAWAASSTPIPL